MGCWPAAWCTALAWRWTGSSALFTPRPVSASWGLRGQRLGHPSSCPLPSFHSLRLPPVLPSLLTPPSFHSLHLPPVLPVAEDGDPTHHVAGCSLPCLGTADRPLEVHGLRGWGRAVQSRPDCASVPCPPGGPKCEGGCRNSVLQSSCPSSALPRWPCSRSAW